MWGLIKTSCWNSLTIAWSYVLIAAGAAFYCLDLASTLVNDPTISAQFTKVFGADPAMMGKITMIVGGITCAARARSLIAGPKQ